MSKFKHLATSWLPVVLWAALIFSVSGDKKSMHHSSRIIEPLVRWLVPDISDEAVRTTVFVVRKGAHVTEYAILALLLWWSLRKTIWPRPGAWSWRQAGAAWSGAVLFAITDEIHQAFVPGRQGSPWDVVIDGIGAALGLWVLWAIRQKLRRRQLGAE